MKDFKDFLNERILKEAIDKQKYSSNLVSISGTDQEKLAAIKKNYNILVSTSNMLTQMFKMMPKSSEAKDSRDLTTSGSENPLQFIRRDMNNVNQEFNDWFKNKYQPNKSDYEALKTAINIKAKTPDELEAKKSQINDAIKNTEARLKDSAPQAKSNKKDEPKDSEENVFDEQDNTLDEAFHITSANYQLHRNVKRKPRKELEGISMDSPESSVENLKKNLESDFLKRGQKLIEMEGDKLNSTLKKVRSRIDVVDRAIRYVKDPDVYFTELSSLINSAYASLSSLSSMLTSIINEYDSNIKFLENKLDNDFLRYFKTETGINLTINIGKNERSVTRKELIKDTAKKLATTTSTKLKDIKTKMDADSEFRSERKKELTRERDEEKKQKKEAEDARAEEEKEKKEAEDKALAELKSDFRKSVSKNSADITRTGSDLSDIKATATSMLRKLADKKNDVVKPTDGEVFGLYALYAYLMNHGGKLDKSTKEDMQENGISNFVKKLERNFDKISENNPRDLLTIIKNSEKPESVLTKTRRRIGSLRDKLKKKEEEKVKASEVGVGEIPSKRDYSELNNTENNQTAGAKDFDNEDEPKSIFDYAVQKAKRLKD